MIVPMKKIAIIVQQKDQEDALMKVRKAGVLHVEHQQAPTGKDIVTLQEELALVNEALVILDQPGRSPVAGSKTPADWKQGVLHIIDTQKRINHLDEFARGLRTAIAQWEKWGDFNPEAIRDLSHKGIFLKLYSIPEKDIKDLPKDYTIKKIFVSAGIAHCLMVAQRPVDISYKEETLPKMSLSKMRQRLSEEEKLIGVLKKNLQEAAGYQPGLLSLRQSLLRDLEYQEALKGMGEQASLAYLAGFIPQDAVLDLQKLSQKEGWGIFITEPTEEDQVPVLIRNPRWVSIISPVFKFLEILPGYRELDISLPFLVFFSIFFGILIGDAGYGLVYALITFLLQQKARKRKNTFNFSLFYLLSLCAIIWGLLTATFFGQEWLVKLGIKPLIPALTDQHNIQAVCFFIGALHLSIAHGWRMALKIPSWSALADIGWILILWTAFFLAKTLVLGDSFPYFGKWLLASGLTLVILFTNPQRNILKGIAEGLGTVALSLMNNFTDVVSYVRLFAVGLAGVAIADAFNSMAALVGHNGILAIILSAFILIIGHTLGVVLGPVSVLVHGVRLNVLEFSGHANVTWSGVSYKPLSENEA